MEIKTGYFAKLTTYKALGYTPIAVVASIPKWYQGLSLPAVAPTWDLVDRYKKGIITPSEYKEEYVDYLSSVDLNSVVATLQKLERVVLLCYEKPGDFCHRHLLAEKLSEVSGLNIHELYVQ